MWALHFVSASLFVIIRQLKLVWTALFSRIMLGRRLSTMHWMAMLGIASGVMFLGVKSDIVMDRGTMLPMAALVLETLLSGFATCCMQMTFENAIDTMWVRNVQLATLSIAIYVGRGVFEGCDFQPTTLGVATGVCGAAGGILVALVLLYAGAVEKTVATNAATACTFMAEWLLFGSQFDVRRLFGCVCVLVDCFIFSKLPKVE